MSSPSPDAVKAEIDQGRMKAGNQILDSNGVPAASNVSQLTADASSKLQVTAHLPVVQPTSTGKIFDLNGTSATGILTNTLVGGASVTTATIGGYMRVDITAAGSGFTSGSYYIPVYVIT